MSISVQQEKIYFSQFKVFSYFWFKVQSYQNRPSQLQILLLPFFLPEVIVWGGLVNKGTYYHGTMMPHLMGR